ncbi:MAG TPA: hypothetical protein VF045_07635 [Acidimicrobiales bacterium]
MQHAVVSHRQLVDVGLTPRQIELRVGQGLLVPVHRGVYRLAGVLPTWQQSAMAACLASGGVVSHRCAAALWELRGCSPTMPEVTVRARRAPELSRVKGHRTTRLDPIDVAERLGIPVTSPARTLFDLGGVVPVERLEPALEDALHRKLVSVAHLERTLARLAARGRDGTSALRTLLACRAPDQAATESPLEDDLIRVLVRAGLPEPARQHWVHLPGGPSFRLDVSYPDRRLAIEAQSMAWHATREDLQRDCDKHNVLLSLGWNVLSFTSHDIRRRPARVAELVWGVFSGVQPTSGDQTTAGVGWAPQNPGRSRAVP